jgi:dihydroorotase
MLEMYHQGIFTLEKIIEKMSHNPAILFNIKQRGFIKKGYFADLVLVDLNNSWTVKKDNLIYKCGWSPFEETTFKSKVISTFVNGELIYHNGMFNDKLKGMALEFSR